MEVDIVMCDDFSSHLVVFSLLDNVPIDCVGGDDSFYAWYSNDQHFSRATIFLWFGLDTQSSLNNVIHFLASIRF